MDSILHTGAAEIVAGIRRRLFSPVDVLKAHIARIEAINPHINALITPMFEQARAEAVRAEQSIAQHGADNLPPLFGLPVTVKDCWAVKGMRFTGGSWYLRDKVAAEDAEVVRLLREAGAIILGKTNLPDMCWAAETVNPIFGLTRNPHDPGHTAGGSSGGEGALIAAGGSPLGIGSDIAGSVRIPAAANGIVSLKPTAGRIPAEDHVPSVSDRLAGWNTAGPMARRVEDLGLALQVLSRTPVQDYTALDLSGRRCVVTIQNTMSWLISPHRSIVAVIEQAARTLKAAGMEIERDDSLPIAPAGMAYMALMRRYGNPDFKRALGGGQPYRLWREVLRNLSGHGRISWPVLVHTAQVDLGGLVMKWQGLEDFDMLTGFRETMLARMGEGGVILCPILMSAAPRHGWTWTVIRQLPYSFMFNALGFPAVVVPVGYTEQGLPLSVQIVARPDEDEIALAVAAELERVHGGWRMAELT